ncbi:MAG: response regulator [Thermorudis peleae]|nr:response regulator [Thermorudis peleae]
MSAQRVFQPRFRHVLIVEDDPALARVIARNLEHRGVTARLAQSVEEAQAVLAAWHPDVLVLDIGLPGRTGWDLVRELQATGRTLPIIVLTGGPLSQRRMTEFQPYACLPKPFPLDALIRLITGSDDAGGEGAADA